MKKHDGFNDYIRRLREKNYFSFMKLNHGFWEYVAGDDVAKELFANWGAVEPIEEILSFVRSFPKTNSLFLGVGTGGHDKADHGTQRLEDAIRQTVPEDLDLHCAISFKRAFVHGKMGRFASAINSYKVVCIGLSHLKEFGERNGISDYTHHCIKLDELRRRDELLARLSENHTANTVYLLQCGEVLSSWLILKLYNNLPDCFILDAGRSLDYNTVFVDSSEDRKLYEELSGRSDYNRLIYHPWMDKKNWHIKLI